MSPPTHATPPSNATSPTYVPAPSLVRPEVPLHNAFISQKLNNFTRAPDYIAYLAYILSSMPQEDDRIRTIAGYLLKNNARLILRASPDVTAFVKSAVLAAFSDPSIMIRNAASQDVVSFLGILEPKNWPECLQQLVHMLDSPSPEQQEVRATMVFSGLRHFFRNVLLLPPSRFASPTCGGSAHSPCI